MHLLIDGTCKGTSDFERQTVAGMVFLPTRREALTRRECPLISLRHPNSMDTGNDFSYFTCFTL